MAHYAKVENGIVTNVIVADEDVISSGVFGSGWVQTSYNTHGGVHPENRPLRKNFAAVGYKYDSVRDAFIPPKPFESWVLNEEACEWEAPVARPDENKLYDWDEATTSWIEVT
tara:strand:- start:1041 stop:1379 length:339 start_codon:yes stop_codon:yes gene_type:complete